MFRVRRFVLAILFFVLRADWAIAQADPSHVLISFDEKGKLEQPKSWAAVKNEIAKRKPNHVFIIAHGWRVSKTGADGTVADFAKRLRAQQGQDDIIQVIGVRWPSLLGENDGALDLALKEAARSLAKSMGKSETVKEYQEKLKTVLKKTSTRLLLSVTLKFQLPPDAELDQMIDNFQDVENVESALTMLSYCEMKRRADLVGSKGLQECLTQLQEALPGARVHLVGHSFGCKVCLACLASEGRVGKQVDSATLLQGAVSALCFAPKIDDVDDMPKGAYADVPQRVKGCISITFTKNDDALRVAYVGASQAAGQVGELPGTTYQKKLSLYAALGGKGVVGLPEVSRGELGAKKAAYHLRPGLNVFNADKVIEGHADVRRDEVAWLIWATASFTRHSP